jgi:hypothetical protein
MPRFGDVFDDVRDNGRTMRISCHEDQGTVVVSLWQNALCRGSFRLAAADLGRFMSALTEMSVPLTATTRPADEAGGSASDEPDPGSAATALGTAHTAAPPSAAQADDATGTADMIRLPSAPILRTA